MCSIAGSGAKNPEDVEKMLQIMGHRSPNGENFFYDERYCIGMGRLKIIGDYTFPLQQDGLVLSFNGEIFNYLELRGELQDLGHVFLTNSDAEVLLQSYKEWGIKCLDKFNGMFAFAIYDGNNIFLARDIAGEKPLYFRRKNFAFASEAKALNWDCEELKPAHYLIYDIPTNHISIKKYWTPKHRKLILKEAAEELEFLLDDSIKLRTRSDVPYGLYLSGGVDSTLISTFHNFEYTFTYKDGSKDEFLELLPKIAWHLDYPISHFSAYALWKLAEEASKKVKVILSGEGADELFGGYIRYVLPNFNYWARMKYPSYSKMFEPAKSVNDSGWEEFNGNLRELLRMGDRMSSAFGIENRCPFLDKRIIEFAFNLNNSLKINGVETKVLLNKILKKRKPNYQPIEKAGLFVPANRWLGVENEGYGKETYVRKQKEALDIAKRRRADSESDNRVNEELSAHAHV